MPDRLGTHNQTLIQALGEIIYEWQLVSDTLQWLGDYERSLGYSLIEMGRRRADWLNRVHPDDRAHVRQAMAEALQTQQAYKLEYRLKRQMALICGCKTRARS